jgi:ADP-ribosylglycohydrolase
MYGPAGIRSYRLGPKGKALISDDTQMTLFTAAGLLYGKSRGAKDKDLLDAVRCSYYDWLRTQQMAFLEDEEVLSELKNRSAVSRLADVQALYSLRAPGNTCLNALATFEAYDTERRANTRKGCGGIMRVAPAGIFFPPEGEGDYTMSDAELLRFGADIAAITHGHPLGYIPAGITALLVRKAIYEGPEKDLGTLLDETMAAARRTFKEEAAPHQADEAAAMDYVEELVSMARMLAMNDHSNTDNILLLGEGWVAEETLAIAVYCALRYERDLSAALIAAVNHDGDSDSTGAVAGNILGAYLGTAGLGEQWTKDLELADLISEMAGELCD